MSSAFIPLEANLAKEISRLLGTRPEPEVRLQHKRLESK
jgi:hypothetical protein